MNEDIPATSNLQGYIASFSASGVVGIASTEATISLEGEMK